MSNAPSKKPIPSSGNPIKILFMGTPDFAIPTLDALAGMKKSGVEIISIVSAPDRKAGRDLKLTSPPVKTWAVGHKIPVLQFERVHTAETDEKIRALQPDMIVVLAYGEILPGEILSIPKYGALNIHPSLLPKYRGASPIQAAILNNDAKTGVTVIQMDEKIDHGPILAIREVPIDRRETYRTLSEKLKLLCGEILTELIPKIVRGEITPMPQNDLDATYTTLLDRNSGRIVWDRDAREIDRQIRAFDPWPGSFTEWETRGGILKLKILEAEVGKEEKTNFSYGQVFLTTAGEVAVQTAGMYLIVKRIQPESKNEMTAKDFLNGYPNIVGAILV